LALSRHGCAGQVCLLLGAKQTSLFRALMSASDPKRTFVGSAGNSTQSEIDDAAGADITEGVEAAVQRSAGKLAVMLAILDPERHGGAVDLLHRAEAPARELASGDACVKRRRPDLIEILGVLAVEDGSAEARLFVADAALHIPLVTVGLGDSAQDERAMVVLLAIVGMEEESACQVLDIEARLEETRVLVARDEALDDLVGVDRVACAERDLEAAHLAVKPQCDLSWPKLADQENPPKTGLS
jgi:hypothetical protein